MLCTLCYISPLTTCNLPSFPSTPLQLETAAVTIHEALKVVIDYQTHHRLREAQGRASAEHLNERVQYWSVGQSVVILIVGIGQIIVLRSYFTEKRTSHQHGVGT